MITYHPGMCAMIETTPRGTTDVDWYSDFDTAYENNSAFAGPFPYWCDKACSDYVTLAEAAALIEAL